MYVSSLRSGKGNRAKEPELEKESIDKIMTENGNDINATKQKLEAERDNYKEQLETTTATLKTF